MMYPDKLKEFLKVEINLCNKISETGRGTKALPSLQKQVMMISEVIPTKEHSQSYFKEQEYIKLQKERNARDKQLKYQEQRKAKAEKDRLWKEKHPNGRAKRKGI